MNQKNDKNQKPFKSTEPDTGSKRDRDDFNIVTGEDHTTVREKQLRKHFRHSNEEECKKCR